MNAVAEALSTLVDTLAFARSQTDADDKRFLTIALTLGVQQACVVALLGYESSNPEDVLDHQRRDGETRLAQVGELMRRVRSPDYLNDPERLSLPHSATKAVRALAEFRNYALHPLPGEIAPEFKPAYLQKALDVIEHLTLAHPAFDPDAYRPLLAFISDHIAALRS